MVDLYLDILIITLTINRLNVSIKIRNCWDKKQFQTVFPRNPFQCTNRFKSK